MRDLALSLRFRIMVGVLIPLLAILSLFFYVRFSRYQRLLMYNPQLSAAHAGEIIEGSLQHAMLSNDLSTIQLIMDNIGQQPGVRDLFMLDKQGRVVTSTDGAMTGKTMDITDATCQACHSHTVASRNESVILTFNSGPRVYRNVNAIEAKPECASCHAGENPLLGVLISDFDLASIDRALAAEGRASFLWAVGSIFLALLIINLLMSKLVIGRLEQLAKAMRRQALGFSSQRLPPAVETALYRIVQEALTNVARHAQAKNVGVLLEHKGATALLMVEDDGKGFDVTQVMGSQPRASNLGLYGMQERAALLGGTLTMESSVDIEGKVPASCAKCHSAQGLPLFLTDGASISQRPSNGFLCTTCHDSLAKYTRYAAKSVQFPSGAVIDAGDPNTNLCMNCHQGRESTTSINKAVTGLDPDTASDKLRFLNPHYFAAGASIFGAQAKGAYEYEGQKCVGRNAHVEGFSNCTQCHDTHNLEVRVDKCSTCHAGVKTVDDLRTVIRKSADDYNGNGDIKEGIGQEIDSLSVALYAAIQAYAKEVAGAGLVFSASSYPYFFVDKNGNGQADKDEQVAANGYNKWTPRLLRAAYNYQYVNKDPGAFAHNSRYLAQVLYDSLADLGTKASVNVKGMVRPSAP